MPRTLPVIPAPAPPSLLPRRAPPPRAPSLPPCPLRCVAPLCVPASRQALPPFPLGAPPGRPCCLFFSPLDFMQQHVPAVRRRRQGQDCDTRDAWAAGKARWARAASERCRSRRRLSGAGMGCSRRCSAAEILVAKHPDLTAGRGRGERMKQRTNAWTVPQSRGLPAPAPGPPAPKQGQGPSQGPCCSSRLCL